MFLKSLTLKGFKSFAQTTTLEFSPGLSVIVGPNGSGKSNIVDAVNWVLGSQSPTALRSQQMDDVIFAGNPGRPALGRAEVTLGFDNADRRLPLELDEVAISRTLFRSGDSGYAINAAPARLLDISELLSAAGVGRHRHVIVNQGHIDAVLRAKGTERRAILEEAAGVSAYRTRKEKALRRLEDAEANLARLGDQLTEIRRALRPLEQQAEVARRHGALAEELEALQIYRIGSELAKLRTRRRDVATQRRNLADNQAALRRRLSVLEEGIADAEARLSGTGSLALVEAAERLERLEERTRLVERAVSRRGVDYERRRGERLATDLVESLSDEAARIDAELAGMRAAGEELTTERHRLEADRARLESDTAAHTTGAGAACEADRSAAAQLEGRHAALREMAEAAETARDKFANRAERLIERRAGAQSAVDAAAAELAACRSGADAASVALEAAESLRAAGRAAESAARQALVDATAEENRWRARAEALAMAMGDVRARSGMEVLATLDGVLGPLGELVAVPEGWEAAFEAAAGEALAAVVLEDPAAARSALEALTAAEVPGAVLPVTGAGAGPPPVGEPLRRRVRGSGREVDEVLDGLIGDVVVVPSWQEACDVLAAHPGATVVTLAGDCFSPSGWRVGVDRSGVTADALAESRERLGRAEISLAEARKAAADAASSTSAAQAAHTGAAEAHRKATRRLAEAEKRAGASNEQLSAVATDEATVTERLAEFSDRAAGARRSATEAAGRLAELRRTVEAAEAAVAGEVAGLEHRRSRLEAAQRATEARAGEIEARRAVLSERRDAIAERLAGHDTAVASGAADARRGASLRDSAERLATAAQQCRSGLERLRARQRQVAEANRRTAERLDGDRRLRGELTASLEEIGGQLLEIRHSEDELGLRIESLLETLAERHDCDEFTATGATCPDLPEGTGVAGRIGELEKLLRGIGPVNPLAVREHEILRERHDVLSGEISDVRSARRDLLKLVREVEGEILKAFSHCYSEVAESFETIFGVLFEGGSGRLSLSDPQDPLGSGVEIEARPAGKSLRRLALLSGGERSLAALAFLFAMFGTQNHPFYVLDEVDAALDDINLHRFLRLLEDYRSRAQFVLVTHQKATMESADRLYGVTMRPGGTSVVISESGNESSMLQVADAGMPGAN